MVNDNHTRRINTELNKDLRGELEQKNMEFKPRMETCKKNSGKCPHNHEDEGEIPCYLCYAEHLHSEGYRNIKNIKLTAIKNKGE